MLRLCNRLRPGVPGQFQAGSKDDADVKGEIVLAKIEYDAVDLKYFNETEEGRKYLEYNDKVGGEPIGMIVTFGYPEGVAELGGVIAVYEECIRAGVTWEDLLDYHPPEDAEI